MQRDSTEDNELIKRRLKAKPPKNRNKDDSDNESDERRDAGASTSALPSLGKAGKGKGPNTSKVKPGLAEPNTDEFRDTTKALQFLLERFKDPNFESYIRSLPTVLPGGSHADADTKEQPSGKSELISRESQDGVSNLQVLPGAVDASSAGTRVSLPGAVIDTRLTATGIPSVSTTYSKQILDKLVEFVNSINAPPLTLTPLEHRSPIIVVASNLSLSSFVVEPDILKEEVKSLIKLNPMRLGSQAPTITIEGVESHESYLLKSFEYFSPDVAELSVTWSDGVQKRAAEMGITFSKNVPFARDTADKVFIPTTIARTLSSDVQARALGAIGLGIILYREGGGIYELNKRPDFMYEETRTATYGESLYKRVFSGSFIVPPPVHPKLVLPVMEAEARSTLNPVLQRAQEIYEQMEDPIVARRDVEFMSGTKNVIFNAKYPVMTDKLNANLIELDIYKNKSGSSAVQRVINIIQTESSAVGKLEFDTTKMQNIKLFTVPRMEDAMVKFIIASAIFDSITPVVEDILIEDFLSKSVFSVSGTRGALSAALQEATAERNRQAMELIEALQRPINQSYETCTRLVMNEFLPEFRKVNSSHIIITGKKEEDIAVMLALITDWIMLPRTLNACRHVVTNFIESFVQKYRSDLWTALRDFYTPDELNKAAFMTQEDTDSGLVSPLFARRAVIEGGLDPGMRNQFSQLMQLFDPIVVRCRSPVNRDSFPRLFNDSGFKVGYPDRYDAQTNPIHTRISNAISYITSVVQPTAAEARNQFSNLMAYIKSAFLPLSRKIGLVSRVSDEIDVHPLNFGHYLTDELYTPLPPRPGIRCQSEERRTSRAGLFIEEPLEYRVGVMFSFDNEVSIPLLGDLNGQIINRNPDESVRPVYPVRDVPAQVSQLLNILNKINEKMEPMAVVFKILEMMESGVKPGTRVRNLLRNASGLDSGTNAKYTVSFLMKIAGADDGSFRRVQGSPDLTSPSSLTTPTTCLVSRDFQSEVVGDVTPYSPSILNKRAEFLDQADVMKLKLCLNAATDPNSAMTTIGRGLYIKKHVYVGRTKLQSEIPGGPRNFINGRWVSERPVLDWNPERYISTLTVEGQPTKVFTYEGRQYLDEVQFPEIDFRMTREQMMRSKTELPILSSGINSGKLGILLPDMDYIPTKRVLSQAESATLNLQEMFRLFVSEAIPNVYLDEAWVNRMIPAVPIPLIGSKVVWLHPLTGFRDSTIISTSAYNSANYAGAELKIPEPEIFTPIRSGSAFTMENGELAGWGVDKLKLVSEVTFYHKVISPKEVTFKYERTSVLTPASNNWASQWGNQ